MATIGDLKATLREDSGKQIAKKLRNQGFVPGVFYHKDEAPFGLSFGLKDVQGILANRPPLLKVSWGEGEDEFRECVIREVQYHPVTHMPIHMDLLGITRGQMIESTVPVKLMGTPEGVRTSGGILQQIIAKLDIRCLPKDIPDVIEVDVSHLDVGNSVLLNEIELEGIEFVIGGNRTVANVVAPTLKLAEEEEEEDEEGEGAEEAGEEQESTEGE